MLEVGKTNEIGLEMTTKQDWIRNDNLEKS